MQNIAVHIAKASNRSRRRVLHFSSNREKTYRRGTFLTINLDLPALMTRNFAIDRGGQYQLCQRKALIGYDPYKHNSCFDFFNFFIG